MKTDEESIFSTVNAKDVYHTAFLHTDKLENISHKLDLSSLSISTVDFLAYVLIAASIFIILRKFLTG